MFLGDGHRGDKQDHSVTSGPPPRSRNILKSSAYVVLYIQTSAYLQQNEVCTQQASNLGD